ncbi:MAG: hypothetical protein JWN86_2735 [Planctomycetota bacterium]|nr:hypothetical protein [Planctomycetota bacterium]
MSDAIVPLRTNFAVFGGLMVLLLATVGLARFDLGRGNLIVAMTIAAIKALLVLLYFMHLKYSHRLTWVVAVAGIIWLSLLLLLTLSDFTSRGWIDVPGK